MRWLLALWLAIAPAWAQEPIIGSGVYAPKSSATYTGPGDVISGAIVWYGFRAYSNAVAQAGTPNLVNIRRTSDNHTCDLPPTTTGGLGNTLNCSTGGDNGQSASSFCNATNCWVTKTYDQSGNNGCTGAPCDLSQATAANQPQFLLTGCSSGSLPCMQRTAGAVASVSGTAPAQTAPSSYSAVQDLYNGANFDFVCGSNATPNGLFVQSTIFGVSGSSSLSATATNNVWHAGTGVLNGASSFMNIDGTQTTGTAGSRTNSADFKWGGGNALNNMSECGMWAGALTNTQANNMCHNQNNYWGTGLSC